MLKKMMKRLLELNKLSPIQLREEDILKKCGCICYCPECKDILQDQAECKDEEFVEYKCGCGAKSQWSFDIAPMPILMDGKGRIK